MAAAVHITESLPDPWSDPTAFAGIAAPVDQFAVYHERQIVAAKAIAFVRFLSCLHETNNYVELAINRFARLFSRSAFADLITKAAIIPGTATDATWGGPLAPLKPLADGFLAYARPLSVIGRIPGLRMVPFNVQFSVQTGVGGYAWVGENYAKPASALAYATKSLSFAKAAGTVVVTDELLRLSVPDAEPLLRDDLAAGVNAFVDAQFLLPSKTAAAGISPASITNGVTPIAPTGTTTAALKADVGALIAQWVANNPDTTRGVLLFAPREAAMLNASLAVPTVLLNGVGSYSGFPTVVSGSVGTTIVMLDANAVYVADAGVAVSLSKNATIELADTPSSPPVAAGVMTSLWQENLIGVRAERYITWVKGRATAVSLVSPTAYVPGT